MNDILDPDDIAARWKVTRDYALRYIVRLPEFPDPIPGCTRKTKRWRASEVDALLAGTETPAAERPN